MPSVDEKQGVVTLNANILAEKGIRLDNDSYILDFGCGSGRHVYEYLENGYRNVFGYDIKNYVELRDPADIRRFRFDPDQRISSIPFPDNYFDFVHSTSVFEHVQEQKLAFQEIYRILKPGGLSLHNFPSKWRPIEPHIYVPLGGVFRSYYYFLFWAALGVRNGFQKGLSARETARRNYGYAQTGIKYLRGAELKQILSEVFDLYSYEEIAFLKHSRGRSHILHRPVTLLPFLVHFFRHFHTRVVLLEKTGSK